MTRVITRYRSEADDSGSELPIALFHIDPMTGHTEEAGSCGVGGPCICCDRYLAWRILASMRYVPA